MFFASVAAAFFGVWLGANASKMKQYEYSMHVNAITNHPLTEGCEPFLPHRNANFLGGAIAAVLASYLLQLIYYRIVLYVAFGNQLDPEQPLSSANS